MPGVRMGAGPPTGQHCVRCQGQGVIPGFRHVEQGRCFRCGGSGVDPGGGSPQSQAGESKPQAQAPYLCKEVRVAGAKYFVCRSKNWAKGRFLLMRPEDFETYHPDQEIGLLFEVSGGTARMELLQPGAGLPPYPLIAAFVPDLARTIRSIEYGDGSVRDPHQRLGQRWRSFLQKTESGLTAALRRR